MAKPPRFDSTAMKQRLQHRESPAREALPHPARALEGPRAATDHLLLDPEEIVLEGPYVRQHVDEQELDSLAQAIRAGGEIKQAIGVRTEGTPLEPRYVLIYGMRRWLASRRAGLRRIPVRNHGRISVADSLALQVTENEARVDPQTTARPGQRLRLAVDPAKLHFFDPGTGLRLEPEREPALV